MKLHGLPPTMREKTRYILCEIKGTKAELSAIDEAIKQCVAHYVGVKGLAEAGVYVVEAYSKLPHIVVRVTSKYVEDVKKSFQYFSEYCEGDIQTVKTSGIISHVADNVDKKKAKTGNTKHLVKLCRAQTIN